MTIERKTQQPTSIGTEMAHVRLGNAEWIYRPETGGLPEFYIDERHLDVMYVAIPGEVAIPLSVRDVFAALETAVRGALAVGWKPATPETERMVRLYAQVGEESE